MNPGQELSSVDFESLIGGPLIAVVHAQAQAAFATVNFIKQVGFKPGTLVDDDDDPNTPPQQQTGDPATVEFTYKKITQNADGTPGEQSTSLSVPFLTMLPIPYLRVEEATIDFLAKINSVETRSVDTSFAIDADLQAKMGWGFGGVKLNVSTQYQRQTKEGSTVTRDYSMAVKVKAVQDQMPPGMERLLSILETNIKEVPKTDDSG